MDEVNRRLAGILAADVASYSAKIGADDAETLARVRTLRTDVIELLAATTVGACSKQWATGFWWSSPARCRHCAVPSPSKNAQADGCYPRRAGGEELVTQLRNSPVSSTLFRVFALRNVDAGGSKSTACHSEREFRSRSLGRVPAYVHRKDELASRCRSSGWHLPVPRSFASPTASVYFERPDEFNRALENSCAKHSAKRASRRWARRVRRSRPVRA